MTKAEGALSWFSPPVGDKVGYGYAAVNLIEALNRRGIRVDYNSPTNNVHISWVQPEWYEGESHQYRIGYTPWESTKIPEAWVDRMNACDEIWTPAWFCKEVYETEGVTAPIKVIPHGVNPDHFPITDRTFDDKFYFLHVGGPTERKGAQKVVDAFLDLYDGRDKYELILKCNRHTEARYYDKYEQLKSVTNHPQITVIANELPIDAMRMLYEKCHALVYPSNGEGFGFIPFQAIASGMPTIATNGTAMSDFAHLSMPLDWTWAEGYGVHLGEWMEPDMNHLKLLMAELPANYEAEKQKAIKGAEWIHENLTWDHIASLVIDTLGDKIK